MRKQQQTGHSCHVLKTANTILCEIFLEECIIVTYIFSQYKLLKKIWANLEKDQSTHIKGYHKRENTRILSSSFKQ